MNMKQVEIQSRTRARLLYLLAELETHEVKESFYKENGDTKSLEIEFKRGK